MGGHRTPTRYPGQIVVTPDRARKDMGDIAGLARSIKRDGLLRPLVITPDNRLICGARQLAAWRHLDRWDSPIAVRVMDIDAIARGEWSENTHRKELAWSERVDLAHALRPALQAAARERQKVLGRTHGRVDPVAQIAPEGRVRDTIARGFGISARSLEKAEAVVQFARLDPVRGGPLQDAMDRSGRVHEPYRRLRVLLQADQIRAEPAPLPSRGPYRVMVIDWPWPYDDGAADQSERAPRGYPLMTLPQIRAMLPAVRALGHDDSVLWMWATNSRLPDAFGLLAELGYGHRTLLTWRKDTIGQGRYLREVTEHCILAVRGRPAITLRAQSTILEAPRGREGHKPAAFYDLVESVSPAARYCELFPHLQPPREGWDRNYIGGPPAAVAAIAPPPDPWRRPRGIAIGELVRPGDVVTTSYSSGAYEAVQLRGPYLNEAGAEHWTLVCYDLGANRKRGHRKPCWVNELVAVDGRLLKVDRGNPDEVFAVPAGQRREAAS